MPLGVASEAGWPVDVDAASVAAAAGGGLEGAAGALPACSGSAMLIVLRLRGIACLSHASRRMSFLGVEDLETFFRLLSSATIR